MEALSAITFALVTHPLQALMIGVALFHASRRRRVRGIQQVVVRQSFDSMAPSLRAKAA